MVMEEKLCFTDGDVESRAIVTLKPNCGQRWLRARFSVVTALAPRPALVLPSLAAPARQRDTSSSIDDLGTVSGAASKAWPELA